MKIYYSILSITFLFFLNSCGFNEAKYYTPSEINTKKNNTSLSDLIAGRTHYIQSCKECHRLYKPDRYSAEEWTMYLDEMQEGAEISDAVKNQIFLYLTSEVSE